ncbi:putative aromatic di-alanine and TPR containing protein, partial [Rhizoctonia solani 123E]
MDTSHELSEINKDIKTVNYARSKIPDGHSSMPVLLSYLGRRHLDRFNLLHELDDLEKAIEYRTAELTLTPDNGPGLSEVLFGLALVHGERFKRLGDLHDIEKAIEYSHISIELSTDGDSALPLRLVNHGTALNFRFENLGEMTDLDGAIQYRSRALVLTPEGHPQFPAMLNMLGMAHHARFRHLGELNDIEKAISYETRALSLAPDGHPDLPGVLHNLGAAHDGRFNRLGELCDLEDAIEYEFRAVALTPDGDPDLPMRIMNLGVSHSSRFERLGELSDLKNAIEYKSRALALTPDGHPDLPRILVNLATSHITRFGQLGELSDLEQADTYGSRALALIPDGHPDASNWQYEHAKTHVCYYILTKDPSHSQRSTDLFRSASQSLSGAPRDKYYCAQGWAKVSTLLDPNTCIEAYQTAIDLLPQFIWLGATTRQRYQDLSRTDVLAMQAASVAIHSSDYTLALEWLEHARCVVWNQSLMLRSPVDELQSIHPELGMRLQSVANQLQKADADSRESHTLASGLTTAEEVAQDHRRLAREYNDLLTQIRALPGFGDFLRPMKAAGLVQAARTGPVVVINCHKNSCDALLILPGEDSVGHVPLPNFSAQKAQEARQTLNSSLRCKGIRERGVKVIQEPGHKDDMSSVLASLWHHIV